MSTRSRPNQRPNSPAKRALLALLTMTTLINWRCLRQTGEKGTKLARQFFWLYEIFCAWGAPQHIYLCTFQLRMSWLRFCQTDSAFPPESNIFYSSTVSKHKTITLSEALYLGSSFYVYTERSALGERSDNTKPKDTCGIQREQSTDSTFSDIFSAVSELQTGAVFFIRHLFQP